MLVLVLVPVAQPQQLALNDLKALILNNINSLFSLRILLMKNFEFSFWHASHLNNNASLLPTGCQRILCPIFISVSKPWLNGNFAPWSKYKAAERTACFQLLFYNTIKLVSTKAHHLAPVKSENCFNAWVTVCPEARMNHDLGIHKSNIE